MIKNIFLATTIIGILIISGIDSVNAQSLQIKDLSNSVGSWEGKLTYLD